MRAVYAFVTALVVLAAAPAVSFASDADETIKYRKQIFKALGAHATAMGAIVQGKVDQGAAIADHAAGMALAASLTKAAMTPNVAEGDKEETTALPKVWEEWDQFSGGLDELAVETAALADLAEAGDMDAFGGQLRKVYGLCSACHKAYRK